MPLPSPLSRSSPRPRLLVLDTHPIQYRSPVFRALMAKMPGLKVLFFNEQFDASKWWLGEVGQIPRQTWNLPLREGFDNEIIGTAALSWLEMSRVLKARLRSERPDAVLIYGYYLPEHWLIRRFCATLGIPLIFVGETFSSGGTLLRRLLKRPLLSYFFRGVDRFVAIGEKTQAHYLDWGVEKARIVAAKYCVDGSFFGLSKASVETTRREWRARHQIPEDAFVALFVGRLYERKRPADMVALHTRLTEEKRFHTVIVGNGELEGLIVERAKGLTHFHMLGFQDQAATREAYHGADLLIVPSESETWGLVVNEAFACGLPALVTETCGVANDLVVPGQTGGVFRVGDLDDAASQIRRLLGDSRDRLLWSHNARQKVSSEYGVEQFADAILTAAGKALKAEMDSGKHKE